MIATSQEDEDEVAGGKSLLLQHNVEVVSSFINHTMLRCM